jgi:hypothetical protein
MGSKMLQGTMDQFVVRSPYKRKRPPSDDDSSTGAPSPKSKKTMTTNQCLSVPSLRVVSRLPLSSLSSNQQVGDRLVEEGSDSPQVYDSPVAIGPVNKKSASSSPLVRLSNLLVGLVDTLYCKSPRHPIFGEPANGLIRLPYQSSRANGQCWVNVMKKFARWIVDTMGSRWEENSCWMSNKSQLQITTADGPHSVKVYRQVMVVRLLAFFSDPTDENFTFLTSDQPAESPFSHRCGRGHLRNDGSIGCLNGVFHGTFATRAENEGKKMCTYGALALCPGHGPKLLKCIFTSPDGDLQKCRMTEDHVPKCACAIKCFGP